MPEFQTVPIRGTAAEQAVNHILQRVVNDRNFSWYMIGTESLRKCLDAEGARRGISDEDVERELHEQMEQAQPRLERHRAGRAAVVVAEEKLEALEQTLSEIESLGLIEGWLLERLERAVQDGVASDWEDLRDAQKEARHGN